MKITLTSDEVRNILRSAISEAAVKAGHNTAVDHPTLIQFFEMGTDGLVKVDLHRVEIQVQM